MRQIARLAPLLVIIALPALAQRNVARMDSGSSLPATCNGPTAGHGGDQFQLTSASTGNQFYLCETTNTWVHQGGSAGSGGGATTCAATSGGLGLVYACNGSPAGFALTQGAQVNVSLDVTNAGVSPTLNVNSTGAIALVRKDGSSLAANELPASSKSTLFSYNSASAKFEESEVKLQAGATTCLSFAYAVFPPTADINTACVPQLTSTNDFLAQNAFEVGQLWTEIATPSAPASGKDIPYVNTSDHALHIRSSSGDTAVGVSAGSTLLDYQKATSPVVGTSSDATVYTTTIPGNSIPAGKCIRVEFAVKHTTGSGNATDKIFFGATSVSWLNASGDVTENALWFKVCNDPGSTAPQQIITTPWNFNYASWSGWIGGPVVTTASENTTASVVVKATFNAANTEQMTGRYWYVEAIR